jgi:putative ABC transport system permease protein
VNWALLIPTVLRRLTRFKLKTILMGLGITVGVLATVLLQTAVLSIEDSFNSFINRSYPSGSIVIMAGSGFMGGAQGRSSLLITDIEALVSSLGVKVWDPVVMLGPRDIKYGENNLPVNVAGFSEMAESVRSRSVQEGEFFSAEDIRNRANVALIGSTTAETLFPGRSPIGAQLFMDNVPFEIKGVLETIGVDPHGGDQDNVIWIPYTTLMDKVMKINFISAASLMVEDESREAEMRQEIVQIMRERHQIGEGQEDDFTVVTPVAMRQFRSKTAGTWTLFVRMIVGTLFLVSAIVILSIMQISIKGRTAEIGLRKAMGARSRDLQTQIVLEVLMVSLIASAVGVVLAQIGTEFLTPVLATKFGVKDMNLRILVIATAVGLALVTGLLGGLWPARRAAKLNPVKALK